MHRLVVNPGAPEAWEIQLKPGANSLGREPDTDFAITDPSVSTANCRIEVTEDSVVIHDLGSPNETFVNQQPVRQATLTPGQLFRLGNVELRLEPDPAAPAAQPAS